MVVYIIKRDNILQMCASCQVKLDHVMVCVPAGTITTARRNAKSLITVVAEGTPTDSKPRPNANRGVEKVNYPSHQNQKYTARSTIKITEGDHFGLFYPVCLTSMIHVLYTQYI